ncbi:MAG TPA: MASE1 domain-containing protein [Coleofasciculaceae cyanobacterium]|jgi:signal transduction histidine kinase/integral membrane sensor domain MASE1
MQKTSGRHIWVIGAIAFTYFLAAKLSLLSLNLGVEASPLWPPAGIAVAVLLWRIRWAWVGIVLGSLWVNYAIHAPWLLAVSDTVGDTSQALLGAFLLQKIGFRNAMDRLQDVLSFVVLVVLAVPLAGATISTLLAYGTGQMGWSQVPHNWGTLWIGDGMGVLVLTPLLLDWQVNGQMNRQMNRGRKPWQTQLSFSYPSDRLAQRSGEKLLVLGLLIALSGVIFYSRVPLQIALYPLEYLSFPFAIWAALRFGLPDAALASFVLSAIAISGTALGRGPFAVMPADAGQEVLLLQAFTGVIAMTTLIIAAVKAESRRSEARILLVAERNRLLSEISLRIRQSLDLDTILNTTVAEVRQFLQADRVFITQFNPEGCGRIVAESVGTGWDSLLGWQVADAAVQQEIAAIFAHQSIKVINDTAQATRSPFIEQYHNRYQVKAGMGVPIVIEASEASPFFGVLVVNQCSAPRQWQPLETELMQQLSTHVAIAIQQSQLYQQVQHLNANLEQQVAERTVQLQDSLAKLQGLNQFRDMLIHAIAHDLRTTVMGTLMILNNLKKQPGEKIALARSLLERMTCSGEVQLNKLNQLLEVYNYETAEVKLYRQTTAIASVLPAVIDNLKEALAQNQITLENHISADLPPVWIDRAQIQQVFWHLVNNAIKHNPPGITLLLRAEVEAGRLRCSVEDNGQGMPSSQCDRLFNLRMANEEHQLMGLCLGLYLCQHIISAHGGAIGVNSIPCQGSQFWFVLPLATE